MVKTRVFVMGDEKRGYRYILAGAVDVNETYAVGWKRHPTRASAASSGREYARDLGLKVVYGSQPG